MSAQWETPHTRPDCKRDNKAVRLANASRIGFNVATCKRGYWLHVKGPEGHQYARSLGRVTCEGRAYIEAVMLYGAECSPILRWIAPEDVISCRKAPPRRVLKWIMGDWCDPAALVEMAHSGALSVDEES